MKEVAKIKNYSISEFWYKYYVFCEYNGEEHFEYWFDTLAEAIDYVKGWLK